MSDNLNYYLRLVNASQYPYGAVPRIIELKNSKILIGRGSKTQNIDHIISPKTDTIMISRVHAQISPGISNREGNNWIIEDLNSTNGTFVNKVKIKSKSLSPGDIIMFGGAAHAEVGELVEVPMISVDYVFTIEEGSDWEPAQKRARLGNGHSSNSSPTNMKLISSLSSQIATLTSTNSSLLEIKDQLEGENAVLCDGLDMLVQEVGCSLCHDILLDAVVSPCSHAFCLSCLIKHTSTSSSSSKSSSSSCCCPICLYPLPPSPLMPSSLPLVFRF